MRSRLLRSLLTGLALCAPASALAQTEDPQADAEQGEEQQEGSETEGADVQDAPETAKPATRGREQAPGERHTVERGDTLWDLSQRYLGNPWYWPKVWSYNPEIANPHWIYPGNQVRLYRGGEEGAGRVEPGAQPPLQPPSGEIAGGDTEPAVILDSEQGDEGLVTASGRIGYEPPRGIRVRHQAFVSQRELDESGTIARSFHEAQLLSTGNTAYVRFKRQGDVKLGDRYVLFRAGQRVRHPVTGDAVGYLTTLLGTARVIRTDGKYTTVAIQDTWDEIRRGDLVGPFGERLTEMLEPVPNDRELKGRIVTALVPFAVTLGEHQEVVVDRGSADGVKQGNVFHVVRQGDRGGQFTRPYLQEGSSEDRDLPLEVVGQCMVTDVRERFSNCLITRSLRELVPGDRVEMRPSEPSASAR